MLHAIFVRNSIEYQGNTSTGGWPGHIYDFDSASIDTQSGIADYDNNKLVIPSELDGTHALFGFRFYSDEFVNKAEQFHINLVKNGSVIETCISEIFDNAFSHDTPAETVCFPPLIVSSGDEFQIRILSDGPNFNLDFLPGGGFWGIFWDTLDSVRVSKMIKTSTQADASTSDEAKITMDESVIDQLNAVDLTNDQLAIVSGITSGGTDLNGHLISIGAFMPFGDISTTNSRGGINVNSIGLHIQRYMRNEATIANVLRAESNISVPYLINNDNRTIFLQEKIIKARATVYPGSAICIIDWGVPG